MYFDKKEYRQLKELYGANAVLKKEIINIKNKHFFFRIKDSISKDRRGEVAFFVKRKNGKFILIRSGSYPEDIFRVPTGGINFGEDVLHALYREIDEELGIKCEIDELLGVIHYEFVLFKDKCDFYSYVFLLNEISGNILLDAKENEISEFIEADFEQIKSIKSRLIATVGSMHDWSLFRAKTTGFILKNKKENAI